MMKLRGIIVFLMAVPIFILVARYERQQVAACYEFGSVAAPAPLWMRGLVVITLLLAVGGTWLFTLDLARWMKRKPNERTN